MGQQAYRGHQVSRGVLKRMVTLLYLPYLTHYCGKFIKQGYVYTPYGTYLDEEPPEEKFICDKCFTPERKVALNAMWRSPMKWPFEE